MLMRPARVKQFLFAGNFRLCPSILSQFTLLQQKSQKSLQTPIIGVQGHSRSLMLIPLKSTSPVLVMISSMSVPICKRFHARQANNAKIATFRGVPFLTTTCADLVERRRSGLRLLKSTINAENFVCRLSQSRSPAISAEFTLKMCVTDSQSEITKKFTKAFFYFGSLRSFKVIDVDISKKLVAKTCYAKRHVCVYLQPFSR